MKIFLTILITAVLAIALTVAVMILVLGYATTRKSTPSTNTPTQSTTDSALTTQKAAVESSRTVVLGFLAAKQKRNFDFAKPYMTLDLQAKYTQETFAGVSSPSMGRYEITKAEFLDAAGFVQVTARVYQNLNGVEVGYSDNIYNVVPEGNQYLINEITEGTFVEK